MKFSLHTVTFCLLVIGGLNWGLKLFGWDIGMWGLPEMVAKVVYVLVALSAIYEALTHGSRCRECKPDAGMAKM